MVRNLHNGSLKSLLRSTRSYNAGLNKARVRRTGCPNTWDILRAQWLGLGLLGQAKVHARSPPKGLQAEREKSADSAASPEDEYKLSIRLLVFQLCQLCSAGDLRTRKPRERGDSENPQDGGSTQSNIQRQTSNSEKRKRSGGKLPSNEDAEQNNHDDEDDEREEPPAKNGGH